VEARKMLHSGKKNFFTALFNATVATNSSGNLPSNCFN